MPEKEEKVKKKNQLKAWWKRLGVVLNTSGILWQGGGWCGVVGWGLVGYGILRPAKSEQISATRIVHAENFSIKERKLIATNQVYFVFFTFIHHNSQKEQIFSLFPDPNFRMSQKCPQFYQLCLFVGLGPYSVYSHNQASKCHDLDNFACLWLTKLT